ncbi:MAG: class I SAM-dependent methyltransferase, partial [Phycisphaerae bacterium]|nr:class I SAM-dependent methyltransferase [Phycisphaerae bacterium]
MGNPKKSLKEYTQANRLAWNQAMELHQKANGPKWDDAFSKPGFVAMTGVELELLNSMNISGKRIAHLCCNNGVELMSLKNMGAGQCVGFDICDAAIEEASARALKFDIPCEFVQSDVYDIPEQYHGVFDIVYVSIGCFGWLPDLKLLFRKAASLLGDSGIIFIHEHHPFTEMLPTDDMDDADPLKIIEPYFRNEPYEENDGIDYVGNTTYEAETKYWFVWTLSDILTGLIESGMRITHFSEHPEDISTIHRRNEEAGIE